LGCTFYCLLTGQPPFAGGTIAEKLWRHQQADPPPLEKFRTDVPAGVADVLRRMLAKRPEGRFQTPNEVAQALAEFAEADRAGLPLPRRHAGRRLLLAGLVGISGVGLALWLTRQPRPSATPADKGTESPPAWLRSALAPGESVPGQPAEFSAVLGGQRPRHWGTIQCMLVSPRRNWVARGGKDGVWLSDSQARPRELPTGGGGRWVETTCMAFSADEKTFAIFGQTYILLWDLSDNGLSRRLSW